MKIHHIGYAVKDIEAAKKQFELLGYLQNGQLTEDKKRNIKILFVESDNILVELISPLSKDSPVDGVLSKLGNSPYHICYEVLNIEKTFEVLRKSGYFPLHSAEEAPAIDNRRVAFLFHKDLGIIELVEELPFPPIKP